MQSVQHQAITAQSKNYICLVSRDEFVFRRQLFVAALCLVGV
jgi:hypothetical protein